MRRILYWIPGIGINYVIEDAITLTTFEEIILPVYHAVGITAFIMFWSLKLFSLTF